MFSPRILVVEDDEFFRSAVSRMLARQGYCVLAAAGPSQALETLRTDPPFQIALCDIEMPEARGTDLVREISRVSPQTRTILMTGGSTERPDAPESVPILHKPFSKAQLLSAVEAVLAISAVQAALAGSLAVPTNGTTSDDRHTALTAQLQQARKRCVVAELEFSRVAEDVPSGQSYPEALARIQRSAAVRRRAYAEYQEAKKQLDDYVAAQAVAMNPGQEE